MTESIVMERALVVMAVCLVIQTIGMTVGIMIAFREWRRTKAALDLQMADVRVRLDRVSATVEEAAHAVHQGVDAFHSAVDGTRDALKTAATFVSGPRTALALGAVRGWQWWRRLRNERRGRLAGTPQPKFWVSNESKEGVLR